MGTVFLNPQPRDIVGRAVSGKSFNPGCGVVATGNMLGDAREVDAPSSGDRIDYVIGESQVTDSSSGLLLLPSWTACVQAGASISLGDQLKVSDSQGRFEPAGVMDTHVYFVALESVGTDEYAMVRPIEKE